MKFIRNAASSHEVHSIVHLVDDNFLLTQYFLVGVVSFEIEAVLFHPGPFFYVVSWTFSSHDVNKLKKKQTNLKIFLYHCMINRTSQKRKHQFWELHPIVTDPPGAAIPGLRSPLKCQT